MNIAIIGSTRLSQALTAAFLNAGHEVYQAGTQNNQSGNVPRWDTRDDVHYCSIEDAAAAADFIMICTPAADVREVAYWLGDVRRKVIIDLTANVPNSVEGNRSTVKAIHAITGADHIVKLLSLYGHEDLFKPLFGGKQVQVVLAGDSKKAKEVAKIICKELNVTQFHDFGGVDTLPLFNELAKCCRSMMQINYANTHPALVTKG